MLEKTKRVETIATLPLMEAGEEIKTIPMQKGKNIIITAVDKSINPNFKRCQSQGSAMKIEIRESEDYESPSREEDSSFDREEDS